VIDGKVIDNMGDALANIDHRVHGNSAKLSGLDGRVQADAELVHSVDSRVSSIATNLDHGVVGAGAQASESSAALGAGANAPAKNAVAVGNNSLADRDNSVSVGSEGHERQITNVAPATQRTDAANWGQVQDAISDVKNWADQRFKKVDRRIDRMGAMTAAYGQMAFSAAGVESPNRVGVGIGTQNGQAALAVGYSHQLSKNLNLSFGAAAASGGDVSVGGGLAVGW
jgi:autotransporter adhesin